MGNLGTDKDTQKLARTAKKAGFEVEVTGGNHLKWTAPKQKDGSKPIYFCGLTASDPRRIKKLQKFLRDNGAPV